MHPQDIYSLSPRGEAELRSAATTLTPEQIALMVRFDGHLTLGQVRAALPPEAAKDFDAAFRLLRDRGLLQRVELDPLTLQFNEDVKAFSRAVGAAEADAGVASLRRAGFYVQIARGREGEATLPDDRPLSALLVEDDLALAHFTRAYLILSGFEVRTATHRAGVIAELRKPPRPDLVLLDVELPDADGFDILARMRAHPVLKAVPVIMLTGKATREAVSKGMASGADGYITKPFEPDALMRAVATVLGLPQEQLQRRTRKNDPWVNSDAKDRRPTRG